MKEDILVSVIMNCYNSDEFLNEALESVLNQTYQNWEIIFWDNQSTDNSASIVRAYSDKRIKYFYAPEHTNLAKARNLAIDKANGEWIGLLDADDLWDQNKLLYSIRELNNNKTKNNIALIYSHTFIIDDNDNIIDKTTKIASGCINSRLLIDGNFIVSSSMLIRKSILFKVGKINQILKYCTDYDLSLKLTKKYQAIGMNEYLSFYRMHNNNITYRKRYENDIELVEFLKKYLKDEDTAKLIKIIIYINISHILLLLLLYLIKNKIDYSKIFKSYYSYIVIGFLTLPIKLFIRSYYKFIVR